MEGLPPTLVVPARRLNRAIVHIAVFVGERRQRRNKIGADSACSYRRKQSHGKYPTRKSARDGDDFALQNRSRLMPRASHDDQDFSTEGNTYNSNFLILITTFEITCVALPAWV
jgi:hypothetical protein